MENRELPDWFGGPVSHVHLRSEDEPSVFQNSERHQFTQEAALHYLRQLTGNPDARVADTNHALLGFDIEDVDKPESMSLEKWKNYLVEQASLQVLQKLNKLRENPESKNLIIGVEADIVNEAGDLSLDNNCLQQLDLVIASFHSFIWSAFSGEHYYSKQLLMKAYENVVKNPNVDVLGHPTRPSSRVSTFIYASDYEPALKIMSKNRVAMEVNLLADLDSPKEELTREVIKLALIMDVPLIVGSDFHHFEELEFAKGMNVFPGVVNKENIDKVFAENKGFHFRLLRRLKKNIRTLNGLGVKKENIVNSSNESFDRWKKQRNLISNL